MPLVVRTLLRCPCCGGVPDRYLPIPAAYVDECLQKGVEHPLNAWETLNLDTYLCPLCGATDRDRLQIAFLAEYLASRKQTSCLEIAPSRPVREWLGAQPGVRYRSADLFMPQADDRVDVTDMSCYRDEQFDIVICSHVLEHIPDDLQAMREIRRILAPNGVAVLLVPISRLVETVDEDATVVDESERWKRFGQGDHVRIYGRIGFAGRLERAGFLVQAWQPNPAAAGAWGLAPENRLYLGRPCGEK